MNAVPRWSNTTGSQISNSAVLIDSSNNISGIVNLNSTGTATLSALAATTGTIGGDTIATLTAAQNLSGKTLVAPIISTFEEYTDQGTDPTAPASGKTRLYTKAGVVYSIVNGGTVTAFSGNVVGPASSVDSEFTLFNSTTGKLVKSATGTGYAKGASGVASFVSTIPASDITGRTDGANPAAGRLGETQSINVATTTTAGTYATSASLALSAGKYLVHVFWAADCNTATTFVSGGFSTDSGATTFSDLAIVSATPNAGQFSCTLASSATLSGQLVTELNISAGATYYAKIRTVGAGVNARCNVKFTRIA